MTTEKLADIILDESQGQLSILFHKWKEDPKQYDQEMATTIDKIIHSTIHRQSLRPIYYRFEDTEDLLQELRLLCLQKMHRIDSTRSDNKSIFNYNRISINLALKDKARKVGKRLDREEKENEILGERPKSYSPSLYFNDPILEKIAMALIEKESKKSICANLNITRNQLQKYINKLREIYKEYSND